MGRTEYMRDISPHIYSPGRTNANAKAVPRRPLKRTRLSLLLEAAKIQTVARQLVSIARHPIRPPASLSPFITPPPASLSPARPEGGGKFASLHQSSPSPAPSPVMRAMSSTFDLPPCVDVDSEMDMPFELTPTSFSKTPIPILADFPAGLSLMGKDGIPIETDDEGPTRKKRKLNLPRLKKRARTSKKSAGVKKDKGGAKRQKTCKAKASNRKPTANINNEPKTANNDEGIARFTPLVDTKHWLFCEHCQVALYRVAIPKIHKKKWKHYCFPRGADIPSKSARTSFRPIGIQSKKCKGIHKACTRKCTEVEIRKYGDFKMERLSNSDRVLAGLFHLGTGTSGQIGTAIGLDNLKVQGAIRDLKKDGRVLTIKTIEETRGNRKQSWKLYKLNLE